jgi:aerobic carbon-monoxide dehydrogenase large subunit
MSEDHFPVGLERRKEDYGLITGRSHYVDDLRSPPGRPPVLHMAVVRSIYAHAKIERINLDAARALPEVVAAFEGAELVRSMPTFDSIPVPNLKDPERRPLAVGRARYVGDPIAVVLAENPYAAMDASGLVEVEYTALPSVTDLEAALAPDAPLLYDQLGSNVAFHSRSSGGNIQKAFEHADHTFQMRLVNQRLAPSSLESRACMFDFDSASGQLLAWVSTQSVYRVRDALARFLGLDSSHVTVYNPEVGGAFGVKTALIGEEIVAAALAMKYGRPVKWIEGRGENLQAQAQGRGQVSYVEAAYRNDGRLLGLKLRSIADMGAFLLWVTALVPNRVPSLLSGPYQLQAIESEVIGVFTNKAPTNAYRGAGRPEATYILERTMDRIAHELGLDSAEVRSRNFIPPEAFPYKSVTGVTYDSGNYQPALDKLLKLAGYTGWRTKQQEYRAAKSNKLLGIGLATFNELSGDSLPGLVLRESATVRILRDGTILVQSAVAHNGQGHFTALAQIAAETFGFPGSKVEVRLNDSSLPSFSIGTFGSRVTQVAGSAVLLAAQSVREKALQLAAHILEAAPTDLVLADGKVMVQGVPARSIELGELARLVEAQPDLIERERPNPANGVPVEGLAAWREFAQPSPSFASGAHLAVVEVEAETGEIQILTYVAVDDCGRVLNHYLAEAQMHGGLAQGISQALYEEVIYDEESGQLLTGTLMDYTLPLAKQLPNFVTDFVETPSPTNPLGAKGVGEAGCVGGPPAVVNAVLDALSPFGIKTVDMPLRPEKIWAAVQNAQREE